MTLIDISLSLRAGLPEWPGDTPFTCGLTWAIARGSSVNVSSLTMSPHVGTHADAPFHVGDALPTVEQLALDAFVGPAHVIDVRHVDESITLAHVEQASGTNGLERLLLRTGRTIATGHFTDRWPVLTEACARALLSRGLRLLGVDAPSVDERESKTLPVHHALFEGGAAILENLDLERAAPGRYELLAFPMKLAGGDAAPVRAVLRTTSR
jgi:arylformamidase